MLQLICGSRRWLLVGNCPRKPLRRCIHWALLVIRSLLWLDFLYGFCIHVISYSLQRYSSFILPCSASSVLGITYDKEGVKFTCCDFRLLCAFFFFKSYCISIFFLLPYIIRSGFWSVNSELNLCGIFNFHFKWTASPLSIFFTVGKCNK